MIVEPVPTNPGSPTGRALRIVGVAAPLLLLVGVVAAGALGPPPAARTIPDPSPAVPPSAAAPATRPPALVVDGTGVEFPEVWVGLRVRSVADTRAARRDGAADGIAAVSGYLSYGTLSPACTDAYVEVDRGACDGRTLLADVRIVPGTGTEGGAFAGVGPHLHPVFPPSTRSPSPDASPGPPASAPIPVVLLGRFPPADSCPPDTRGCSQAFIVERVVWVAGTPWASTLTVDPALDIDPEAPAIRASATAAIGALGRGALALAASIVRPDVLRVVDANAAAALTVTGRGDRVRSLAYARGLMFQFDASQPLYGRNPEIGWVVLDATTGEVLVRSGPPAQPYGIDDGAAAQP